MTLTDAERKEEGVGLRAHLCEGALEGQEANAALGLHRNTYAPAGGTREPHFYLYAMRNVGEGETIVCDYGWDAEGWRVNIARGNERARRDEEEKKRRTAENIARSRSRSRAHTRHTQSSSRG